MSRYQIMAERRFGPFFWTQFLGAFNDNFFKIALITMVTWRMTGLVEDEVRGLVILASGLFILPFLLFSATAGQLADRFDKSRLIRAIKLAEIVVMAAGALAFALGSVPFLLLVLFLMGTQSAFFGPVKYSIVPQLLGDEDLTNGNGFIGLGTFVAILAGTILGGIVMGAGGEDLAARHEELVYRVLGVVVSTVGEMPLLLTAIGVLVIAGGGLFAALLVPRVPAADPEARSFPNPLLDTIRAVSWLRQGPTVFWSVIGISFFWFYGAIVYQLIPTYTRFALAGGEGLLTLALTAVSLGIGSGSLACERIASRRVEPGLVVAGGLGIAFAPLLLLLAGEAPLPALTGLFLAGFSGGIFFVPLYSLLQERCPSRLLSRTVAAGCILDALFMVVASLAARALTSAAGFSDAETIAALGGLALVFLILLVLRVPELLFRFSVLPGILLRGGLVYEGRELVPSAGAVLLVCPGGLREALTVAGALARRPLILAARLPRFTGPAKRAGIEAYGRARLLAALAAGEAVILAGVTDAGIPSGGIPCLSVEVSRNAVHFQKK